MVPTRRQRGSCRSSVTRGRQELQRALRATRASHTLVTTSHEKMKEEFANFSKVHSAYHAAQEGNNIAKS